MQNERVETIIIGAGQSGLSAGYHLARRGKKFLILDGNERVGDSWRKRWDSLRVFTPAKYDGLPGMAFPAPRLSFPTKNEVGDYFAAYAERFELPVRTGVLVDDVTRDGSSYIVRAGNRCLEADNVVVATGACQTPKVPAFASELDPALVSMHSTAYRNPSQLKPGAVLIVGMGNSGAEIGFELARTHRVFISGTPSGEIPTPHGAASAMFVLPLVRFLGMHVLTLDTPIGRKVLPGFAKHAAPLIRVRTQELVKAGVERVARVEGVQAGMPCLADGRRLEVENVIWCTGFRYDFSWIRLPITGEDGTPMQYRGVVTSQPGLYFVGLEAQYAAASAVLPGAGRDADYIANHIASSPKPVAEIAPAEAVPAT